MCFDITDTHTYPHCTYDHAERSSERCTSRASQESSISVRNNERGSNKSAGERIVWSHLENSSETAHTGCSIYISTRRRHISKAFYLFILFARERRGAAPKWRLNSPYTLRPRGRVKLCISVDPSLSVSRPGRLIFEASPFRSYAYVPAARPENRCSRRECLAVASFASVNHGLNKIAYPRESNEMSAPGPPPLPEPGPNYSLTDSVVLSSRFSRADNEDRCIQRGQMHPVAPSDFKILPDHFSK